MYGNQNMGNQWQRPNDFEQGEDKNIRGNGNFQRANTQTQYGYSNNRGMNFGSPIDILKNTGNRVQNAINTNDFTGLSRDIKRAVNSYVQGMNAPIYNRNPNPYVMNFLAREQSTTGLVLGMIALGLFMLIFGILTASFLPLGFIKGITGMKIAGFVFAGILAGGIFSFNRCLKSYRFASKYNKYHQVFMMINLDTVNIHRLSLTVKKSEEDTLEDLNEFIDKGLLIEGSISDDGQTLILTRQAETVYRNAENYQKNVGVHISNMEQELNKLKEASMNIDSQSMKDKLYQTVSLVEAIISNVSKNQANIKKALTFETYYLPTTVKLVESYPKIEKSRNAEEEKTKSLSEIEMSVDSINEAFNTLLTNMNKVDTSDVMSDMSAMETMMKQDGLI